MKMKINKKEYWHWEIKFYIKFQSGKKYGTYRVDRYDADTPEEAEVILQEHYEKDEFGLVGAEFEEGDTELVVEDCNKIYPE